MASAPAYPYKRYTEHDSNMMRGRQRQCNPLHEAMRFDASGHTFYETPEATDLELRRKLVNQATKEYIKKREDVLKKPSRLKHASTHRSRPPPQPEPAQLSILEERQQRLSKYIDGYDTEHFFPHIYTGYGPPSYIRVTAFGPNAYTSKMNRKYLTTSQEAYAWEQPDMDVYAERGAFTKKGEFTSYLRATIMKQVNLKKTAH